MPRRIQATFRSSDSRAENYQRNNLSARDDERRSMYQRALAAERGRRQPNGELESGRQFVERLASEEET